MTRNERTSTCVPFWQITTSLGDNDISSKVAATGRKCTRCPILMAICYEPWMPSNPEAWRCTGLPRPSESHRQPSGMRRSAGAFPPTYGRSDSSLRTTRRNHPTHEDIHLSIYCVASRILLADLLLFGATVAYVEFIGGMSQRWLWGKCGFTSCATQYTVLSNFMWVYFQFM